MWLLCDVARGSSNTDKMAAATAAVATTVNDAKIEASQTVTVVYGNVANSAGDEQVATHRFAVREKAVHEAVVATSADVFAASELRICLDKEGKSQLQPVQIAQRMAKGTNLEVADCRPQNLDRMAFWRTTLFNPSKLKMIVSGSVWAVAPVFGSNVVAERGVMLMFTQFAFGKHKFWVINSHMPMATPEKLKTIDWLNANAESTCKKICTDSKPALPCDDEPVILYGGDQNTFFPGPTLAQVDGKDMLDRFAAGGWVHVSKDIKTTFRAFPHDPYTKLNPEGTSLLDHVFVNASGIKKIKIHSVVAHDTKASDHFFLACTISFV